MIISASSLVVLLTYKELIPKNAESQPKSSVLHFYFLNILWIYFMGNYSMAYSSFTYNTSALCKRIIP